jgi:hypothetical protein
MTSAALDRLLAVLVAAIAGTGLLTRAPGRPMPAGYSRCTVSSQGRFS